VRWADKQPVEHRQTVPRKPHPERDEFDADQVGSKAATGVQSRGLEIKWGRKRRRTATAGARTKTGKRRIRQPASARYGRRDPVLTLRERAVSNRRH
jgi:hypothetical protein